MGDRPKKSRIWELRGQVPWAPLKGNQIFDIDYKLTSSVLGCSDCYIMTTDFLLKIKMRARMPARFHSAFSVFCTLVGTLVRLVAALARHLLGWGVFNFWSGG